MTLLHTKHENIASFLLEDGAIKSEAGCSVDDTLNNKLFVGETSLDSYPDHETESKELLGLSACQSGFVKFDIIEFKAKIKDIQSAYKNGYAIHLDFLGLHVSAHLTQTYRIVTSQPILKTIRILMTAKLMIITIISFINISS